MSEHPPVAPREERLYEMASAFPYPPTPDIAAAVGRRLARERAQTARPPLRLARRLVWAAALVLLLAGLLAVPQVQAAIREIVIGSIHIVFAPPSPTPAPGGTATPAATAAPPATLLDLAGATTLVGAQQHVDFTLQIPAYPADLGAPDRVYMQDVGGRAAILVWLVPGQPDQVRLALYELSADAYAEKLASETTVLQQTQVGGQRAVWLQGPHMLQFIRRGQQTMEAGRLVTGNVLLWTAGGVTYRLESMLSLSEAVQVAESLAPVALPTPAPSAGLAHLAGETTLDEARAKIRFPVRLPAYPPSLGAPNRVFVQDLDGPAAILVWTIAGHPERVDTALYELSSAVLGQKSASATTVVQETTVQGQPAAWVRGPHYLEFFDPQGRRTMEPRRLVDANVLIWTAGRITYRLETWLPLDEARRVAESLR